MVNGSNKVTPSLWNPIKSRGQSSSDEELSTYLSVHGFEGTTSDLDDVRMILGTQFLSEQAQIPNKLLQGTTPILSSNPTKAMGWIGPVFSAGKTITSVLNPFDKAVTYENYSAWYSCTSSSCRLDEILFDEN